MAHPLLLVSRGGRLSYLAFHGSRSSVTSSFGNVFPSTSSSSSLSPFDRIGQGYTASYEPGEPTRGPLGNAQREPTITPKHLKAHLDKYVVGQERAKKMLSVAVYNQYQRIQDQQRQEDEERERLAKIARRTMAYEKFARHPVEDEFPGQAPTVKDDVAPLPKELPKIGQAPLDGPKNVIIEKSNVMVLGPSGVGKTMMLKILAQVLEVPFSMSDCTPFTQAGYIGEDAEVCVQRLLAAADYDVARAEHGIICLDEVDKLAMAKIVNGKDVSGEGVQQALLKIIEGTTLQITAKPDRSSQRPSTAGNNFSSFNPNAPNVNAGSPRPETYTIRTDNILFICSGAFVGLQKIIMDRMSRGSIGFGAPIRNSSNPNNPLTLSASDAAAFRKHRSFPSTISGSSPESETTFNPLDFTEPQDFQKFGLIPEFIGRIPITTALSALSLAELVRILTEPRNSIIAQYVALFKASNIDLYISTGALHVLAQDGHAMGTGARGLRSAAENLLWPIMYDTPGSGIRHVLVTQKSACYQEEHHYFSRGLKGRWEADVAQEEREWAGRQARGAAAGKTRDLESASFEEFREQAKSGM